MAGEAEDDIPGKQQQLLHMSTLQQRATTQIFQAQHVNLSS